MSEIPTPDSAPGRDCPLCPRLAAFRNAQRARESGWHNAPVPSFGSDDARLLIVGLAPGLKGANRTGRPFTGDFAGDLLYENLLSFGFATGRYGARPDDGLRLNDAVISNAVRCVPPQNKPTPIETATCRMFLSRQIATLPRLRAVLALGRIAHESLVRASGGRMVQTPFGHGARHNLVGPSGAPFALFDSYHCSRYNTNTGVLTAEMFREVFRNIRLFLDSV